MWSISYEFRCYILIMAVGLSVLANNRKVILLITILFLAAMPFYSLIKISLPNLVTLVTGDVSMSVRLIPIFLSGSIFYLFRDRIVYRPAYVISSVVILALMMSWKWTAELGLSTFGAYVLFWFAFHVPSPFLSRIGGKMDLSYGAYLYAWPVQNYLIWKFHFTSPTKLFIVATTITLVFAYFSWTFIEKPFLSLKNRAKKSPRLAPQASPE